jgi:galacturan 1,4-alpha-galacturonidase
MMADVSNAVKCTSVVLNGFTVPAGQGLVLPLLDGTTVNMCKIIFSTSAK